MKKLFHGQRVILEGNSGIVYTITGYTKEDTNINPYEAIIKAAQNKLSIFSIIKECPTLTNDREFNKKKNKEWENVIRLKNGEIVEIEGNYVKIIYKGNYIDMATFEFVKKEK